MEIKNLRDILRKFFLYQNNFLPKTKKGAPLPSVATPPYAHPKHHTPKTQTYTLRPPLREGFAPHAHPLSLQKRGVVWVIALLFPNSAPTRGASSGALANASIGCYHPTRQWRDVEESDFLLLFY